MKTGDSILGTRLALSSSVGMRRQCTLPGVTYLLTRRTTRRHYVLTPDEGGEVERIVLYLLGHLCTKHGVQLHAVCVMSTHLHYVVTDRRGVIPLFLQEFHRLLANSVKNFRGWPAEVFDKKPTTRTVLLTANADIEEIAYTIANPVAAGAVRYAADWPGLTTAPRDLGTRIECVRRPDHYLRDATTFPDEVEVRFELPARLAAAYGAEDARRLVRLEVEKLEREALRKMRENGWSFLGRARVLRQPHTKRSKSREDFGALTPHFAAAGDVEAVKAHLDRIRAWDGLYDQCLERWRAGDHDALWPPGTWAIVRYHGARAAPPPDDLRQAA